MRLYSLGLTVLLLAVPLTTVLCVGEEPTPEGRYRLVQWGFSSNEGASCVCACENPGYNLLTHMGVPIAGGPHCLGEGPCVAVGLGRFGPGMSTCRYACCPTPVPPPPIIEGRLSVLASPNPFHNGTQLRLQVPGRSNALRQAKLEVIDIAGRRVAVLWDGPIKPGDIDLTWNGRDHAGREVRSGVYYLRLTCGGEHAQQSLLFLK